MAKRLLIAVVITLLVVLAGLFAQSRFFSVPKATPTPVVIASLPSPTPTPAPVEIAPRVIASDVQGEVERQRKSGSDAWTPLKRGDELTQDDAVRTRPGGIAILELGTAATVTVSEDSQVRVAEISRRASRVKLEQGRLSAVVHGREQDSSLKVEFKDSDAVVDAKAGSEFAALTANGQVQVASEKGSVALEAKGARVNIAAGETSVVRQDQAPSAPQKVQASLFLKLNKSAKQLKVAETVVTGEASPGALVVVNGVRTVASAKGIFEAKVRLAEGRNQLVVRATDVRGNTKFAPMLPILVDTKPATVDGKVKW